MTNEKKMQSPGETFDEMFENASRLYNGFYPEIATPENVQKLFDTLRVLVNLKDTMVEYLVNQGK